jgi:hypothetical protein
MGNNYSFRKCWKRQRQSRYVDPYAAFPPIPPTPPGQYFSWYDGIELGPSVWTFNFPQPTFVGATMLAFFWSAGNFVPTPPAGYVLVERLSNSAGGMCVFAWFNAPPHYAERWTGLGTSEYTLQLCIASGFAGFAVEQTDRNRGVLGVNALTVPVNLADDPHLFVAFVIYSPAAAFVVNQDPPLALAANTSGPLFVGQVNGQWLSGVNPLAVNSAVAATVTAVGILVSMY